MITRHPSVTLVVGKVFGMLVTAMSYGVRNSPSMGCPHSSTTCFKGQLSFLVLLISTGVVIPASQCCV